MHALVKEVIAAAPPMPPQFEPFFEPIINLLCSKMMMQLIRVVLCRVAKRSRYASDGLLHRVLYLVGMGLNEQIRQQSFDFIGCAEKALIFDMMRSLVGKTEVEPHADLLGYLIEVVPVIFFYFREILKWPLEGIALSINNFVIVARL
ncbi:unnamed protein product [Gongylonema pulchrum]|uniref:Uncharacterized protein n=1 Tax=Gongylonema pulchrum TaxID=637853 RepID=A0A183D9H9_9BILA|nr:unnamed protein product [Gongylonema pulchrum]